LIGYRFRVQGSGLKAEVQNGLNLEPRTLNL